MKSTSMTILIALVALSATARAAKLVEVRTMDDHTVMVHWLDGIVHDNEVTTGPRAYNAPDGQGGDTIDWYGNRLDIRAAVDPASYSIKSGSETFKPVKVFRKSKVNGSAWGWPDVTCPLEHTVYLQLSRRLEQGRPYTLTIAPGTQTDAVERGFIFDVYSNVSEAIHVNLIGYNPSLTAMKSADLYLWMGDGGARDYSAYVGKKVTLVEAKTGKRHDVGRVAFWKSSGPDYGKWNLTKSDVWTCDFSSFGGSGAYRLAVEGIGCSRDFTLAKDAYFEPFKTCIKGYFFMRIGESKDFFPIPRQPRFIPGVDPPEFKVFRTTYGPTHPDWSRRQGDQWDNVDWSRYMEPGHPTNPNAWGGHSDAADWDRNNSHISNIWDILLPYILSNGKIRDDDLGIRESGNGIPDLIDEARNEVDFWLRLRDGRGGYSFGLNNPTPNRLVMYQAVAHPFMAWASAANSAMLADAFRIDGRTDLAAHYRDAAIEAWNVADEQALDTKFGIGNGSVRGRDMKAIAAAYLYNVTGNRKYEDALAKETVIDGPAAETEQHDRYNQVWAVAGYLMCAKFGLRPIHYPQLLSNMRSSVVAEAMKKNVANSLIWPSRRSSDTDYGWFQTTQEVQRVCVAHAASTSSVEKETLLRALILEADYGLGRNPMNMAQMTGLSCRCVPVMYTSGRNDGIPGVHPGHTPYMNSEAWGSGFMADPQYYARLGYPAWSQWPQGEAYWPARYCYANNEFTPQQTMRGKTCLLGYLYSLGASHPTEK
jgi:hypothetical protein